MNFFEKWILICSLFTAILINLSACSQDNGILSTESTDQNYKTASKDSNELTSSCVVTYIEGTESYSAAAINIPNGSFIRIPANSLIPPAELMGKDVEITMTVDLDLKNSEILFTFGPHGCVFSSPAELCLSWKGLDIQKAALYYLDDENNRKENLPDQIDDSKKRMILFIDHFSRYAVAYSN